jgi:hypothetical protein
MTLAVSLRVPDGLVIAADSLATSIGQIGISAEVQSKCPICKKSIQLKDLKLPPISIPTSLSSYAQKVFPFQDIYGIATYGLGILNEKTIYYHIKMIEKKSFETPYSGVTNVANILKEYFDKEIKKQIKDIEKSPDTFYPLGFLVVGYDDDTGKTIVVKIGKKSVMEEKVGSGCTYGGEGGVVNKLWELSRSQSQRATNFGSFSLQDAVDYAEYLINTTANFQRFAITIPNVGGDVDIALITPFRKFTWIKYKKMTEILEKRDG